MRGRTTSGWLGAGSCGPGIQRMSTANHFFFVGVMEELMSKLRLHGTDRQGMECMLTIEDQITWSQANRGAAMVSRLSESKYFYRFFIFSESLCYMSSQLVTLQKLVLYFFSICSHQYFPKHVYMIILHITYKQLHINYKSL